MTPIQIINVFAFGFIAYILSGVLAESLKDSKLLKPISITICSIAIALHLVEAGAVGSIVASFVGFFIHTCVNGYTRKVKAPAAKNRKKVVNINP